MTRKLGRSRPIEPPDEYDPRRPFSYPPPITGQLSPAELVRALGAQVADRDVVIRDERRERARLRAEVARLLAIIHANANPNQECDA